MFQSCKRTWAAPCLGPEVHTSQAPGLPELSLRPASSRRRYYAVGGGPLATAELQPRTPLPSSPGCRLPGPGDLVGVQPAAGGVSLGSRASRPSSLCGLLLVTGGIRVGLSCRKQLAALQVGCPTRSEYGIYYGRERAIGFRVNPAAHVRPATSSEATTVSKFPAAANRTCTL